MLFLFAFKNKLDIDKWTIWTICWCNDSGRWSWISSYFEWQTAGQICVCGTRHENSTFWFCRHTFYLFLVPQNRLISQILHQHANVHNIQKCTLALFITYELLSISWSHSKTQTCFGTNGACIIRKEFTYFVTYSF